MSVPNWVDHFFLFFINMSKQSNIFLAKRFKKNRLPFLNSIKTMTHPKPLPE